MKLGGLLIAKAKAIKIQKPKIGKPFVGKSINVSKIAGPILKKAISNASSAVSKSAKSSSTSSKTALSIIKKLVKNKSLSGLK